MSRKKSTHVRSEKGGRGGGGGEAEPLEVNWFVIGGAVLIVAAIVFFSLRQSRASSAAVTGGCTPTTQKWSSPPAMTIDPTKTYTATVKLQKGGEFVIQL